MAISRVRCLDGLHLISFNPPSIIVSSYNIIRWKLPTHKKATSKAFITYKSSSSDRKKSTVETSHVITAVHRGPWTEWAYYRYYPVDKSMSSWCYLNTTRPSYKKTYMGWWQLFVSCNVLHNHWLWRATFSNQDCHCFSHEKNFKFVKSVRSSKLHGCL